MYFKADIPESIARALHRGIVIPAVPLALSADRHLDERRQRALLRYYAAAGVGGVAIGVHTTQFAIREPRHNLFETLLRVSASVFNEIDSGLEGPRREPLVRIGGICGQTPQAFREASFLREAGYHAGLLNLGALRESSEQVVIAHCREVAAQIPVFGFYLSESVGGRILPYSFWRQFAEIENVAAVKIACFNRYQTINVIRAIVDAGRDDIALYTGNDDHIILDLITPYRFRRDGQVVTRHFAGGLLGHWAVWTRRAVEQLELCRAANVTGGASDEVLTLANEVTDANAALFDPSHNFAGCIAGLHYVLMRQGLFDNLCLLDPNEALSPGQANEIERVIATYPHLHDDDFVAEHIKRWLS
jgi:dihydrodipicolinate synthase/N-acetylneuraminate lyase